MELLLAIVFGTLFGFALHRVGAADPDKIIGMLQLKDLHLMKTILLAIGLSSLLLFIGLAVGLIPAEHLSIKTMHIGVPLGGAILGIGWGMAAYCPGTAVAALGAGRKDAVFFILGGLVGAALFMSHYEWLESTALLQSLWGGKVTLAANGQSESLLSGIPGLVTAASIAIALIIIAILLPEKWRK